MKMVILGTLFTLFLSVSMPLIVSAASTSSASVAYQALTKPGSKVSLDAGHYFIFGFEKQPKLGSAIMKVNIFTLDGKRDTSFVVKGDMDMPSMRGAHASGDKKFVLSAKGVYLLPAHIAMPGDWEFRFTFEKKGKTVFRGAYQFDL